MKVVMNVRLSRRLEKSDAQAIPGWLILYFAVLIMLCLKIPDLKSSDVKRVILYCAGTPCGEDLA